MKAKGRVIWNQGQAPERPTRSRMPTYSPPKAIEDDGLRDAWFNINVGEMLITTSTHFFQSHYEPFPLPVIYPGGNDYYWSPDTHIPENSFMVYLGTTEVNCLGSKGRIISKPYHTVFYNGGKYLINDQNHFKPVNL